LVIGQLVILYVLSTFRGALPDWSSEARIGVTIGAYLLFGSMAVFVFSGKRARFIWVAAAVALPLLIDEATSRFSPTAYPGLGFVVAPIIVVVALVGAISASRIGSKRDR